MAITLHLAEHYVHSRAPQYIPQDTELVIVRNGAHDRPSVSIWKRMRTLIFNFANDLLLPNWSSVTPLYSFVLTVTNMLAHQCLRTF